jgi:hypothetical protein
LTDLSQLLIGLTLTALSVGSLMVFYPRKGKTAWFVEVPVLNSAIPILMIGTFAIGLMLVAFYFSAVDNATLTGMTRHL